LGSGVRNPPSVSASSPGTKGRELPKRKGVGKKRKRGLCLEGLKKGAARSGKTNSEKGKTFH